MNDVQKNMQNILFHMDDMLKFISVQAKMLYHAKQELIKEGFSEEQAMDIIKARGNTIT